MGQVLTLSIRTLIYVQIGFFKPRKGQGHFYVTSSDKNVSKKLFECLRGDNVLDRAGKPKVKFMQGSR